MRRFNLHFSTGGIHIPVSPSLWDIYMMNTGPALSLHSHYTFSDNILICWDVIYQGISESLPNTSDSVDTLSTKHHSQLSFQNAGTLLLTKGGNGLNPLNFCTFCTRTYIKVLQWLYSIGNSRRQLSYTGFLAQRESPVTMGYISPVIFTIPQAYSEVQRAV